MSTTSDDWWEDWMRRQSRFPVSFPAYFGDIDEFMRQLDREFEKEFNWISEHGPKELIRERPSKGVSIREFGPFVYGYSVRNGPDGKRVIREFGNIKPGPAIGRPSIQLKSEREPVVDVIEEEKTIRVVVELPGMKKEEIQLNATENSLSLKAEGENRKYFRDVPLPVKVDTSSAKATYLNGILEVTLQKKRIESNEQAVKINID